ncbi:MAG TPA: amino acid adenylation domain-containing protein, partial [Archangium sp.]|nr:amino acid adenylation domain-containing protein [Archangium sp.]
SSSFLQLLSHVRSLTLAAYSHQDLPFEKLVEELHPSRDLSRNPLFQVVFNLQNTPQPELAVPGLKLRHVEVEIPISKFDLSLALAETAEGLEGSLEYNTDLFEPATAARMAEHFRVLLEGIVANPEQRLSELPLLTEAERRQLLVDWNPRTDVPREDCIHHLVEARVKQSPDAVAVSYEDQHLTYRELNRRANRLAHHLRALGVGPETKVGLALERSLEMVVAILGVLKAGGAYVPLDPAYPKERLAFMLQDSRVPVLLTQARLRESFPPSDAEVICLDVPDPVLDSRNEADPRPLATSANLAYVIYTSGSTGKPKGALLSHAEVVRLFGATEHWFHFDASDVWTLFHSYAFDFSVWELWGALLYGGRVVVVPYEVSRSPKLFHELLHREQVTVLNQTPSAFRQLIQYEESSGRSEGLALRYVVFGGEALEFGALRPWFERHGDARPQLVNMYGITETTVHVTYRPLSAADAEGAPGSNVGVPIPDLQTYVLDSGLRPVPVGVPGELFVGGVGLARGYLNRPELTAERFIPNPFGTAPGERLYRSGDLARYRPDGTLEYLGRIDHQVKVRGFRVELGEIEAALLEHPDLREAVVLAREDVPGDKRLVAYIVAASNRHAPGAAELRDRLKARLPEYMVPSAFVPLPMLPLTSHGKVDRRALPVPGTVRTQVARELVAPQSPLELQLVRIWEDVLGVSPLGIRDDFFELGGHSMLAVQLVERLRKETGRDFPLVSLFKGATVEKMATLLEQRDARPWSPLVPLKPHGTQAPLFCIHPMGGNVLCYVELARLLDAEQPCYGVQARGVEGGEPCSSIEEMAALYIEALRSVQPTGPYHLAGWSLGGIVVLEMARQLTARGEQVGLAAIIDAYPLSTMREGVASDAELLEDMLTQELASMLLPLTGEDPAALKERLGRMPREARLQHFYEEHQKANSPLAQVGFERVNNLYRVFEYTARAWVSYRPQPYTGRLTLLRATEDMAGKPVQAEHGWEPIATGGLDIREVSGNHMSIMRRPRLGDLVRLLEELMGAGR